LLLATCVANYVSLRVDTFLPLTDRKIAESLKGTKRTAQLVQWRAAGWKDEELWFEHRRGIRFICSRLGGPLALLIKWNGANSRGWNGGAITSLPHTCLWWHKNSFTALYS